jgi:hypothetical protein
VNSPSGKGLCRASIAGARRGQRTASDLLLLCCSQRQQVPAGRETCPQNAIKCFVIVNCLIDHHPTVYGVSWGFVLCVWLVLLLLLLLSLLLASAPLLLRSFPCTFSHKSTPNVLSP